VAEATNILREEEEYLFPQ